MNINKHFYTVARCSHCNNAILSDQEQCILSFCLAERDAFALLDTAPFLQEPISIKTSIVPETGLCRVPAPLTPFWLHSANDAEFVSFPVKF